MVSSQILRCRHKYCCLEAVKTVVFGLMGSVVKHDVLLLIIFTFILATARDNSLTLVQLALRCVTGCAGIHRILNTQSLICTVSSQLIHIAQRVIIIGVAYSVILKDAVQVLMMKICSLLHFHYKRSQCHFIHGHYVV